MSPDQSPGDFYYSLRGDLRVKKNSTLMKFCCGPRCNELIPQGKMRFCSECARKYNKEKSYKQDKRIRKFYGSQRWKKIRAEVLTSEPFCSCCKEYGYIEIATEVHHLHHKLVDCDDAMATDKDNLVSLCHKCHDLLEPYVGDIEGTINAIKDGVFNWRKHK